jgi:linoleoyl-CoA desaturase
MQIEHHLFPKICHTHYGAIAVIIKQTAEEFGIPYYENATFGKALLSHYRMLRRFGKEALDREKLDLKPAAAV